MKLKNNELLFSNLPLTVGMFTEMVCELIDW